MAPDGDMYQFAIMYSVFLNSPFAKGMVYIGVIIEGPNMLFA